MYSFGVKVRRSLPSRSYRVGTIWNNMATEQYKCMRIRGPKLVQSSAYFVVSIFMNEIKTITLPSNYVYCMYIDGTGQACVVFHIHFGVHCLLTTVPRLD